MRKIDIFQVFAKNMLLQFSAIFLLKNLPKTLPKRSLTPFKTDVKNASFFNVDIFGLRPRFWQLWGLQDGAKLAILPTHQFEDLPVWTLLSERSQKNTFLEGSGFDFGGPRVRFWRPRGSILDRFFENVRRFLGSFGKKVFLTSVLNS